MMKYWDLFSLLRGPMCKVVLFDLSEPAHSVLYGPNYSAAVWMTVGSQVSSLFILITFRLHWWAAESPGWWGKNSVEHWTTGSTGVTVWQSSNLCKREIWPVGPCTESRLRLPAAATCVVQRPAAHVWCSYLMVKPGAGDLGPSSVS